MNYKSFVLALGLLLVSGTAIYAQNKGKSVTKAVEGVVTNKVPVTPGKLPTTPGRVIVTPGKLPNGAGKVAAPAGVNVPGTRAVAGQKSVNAPAAISVPVLSGGALVEKTMKERTAAAKPEVMLSGADVAKKMIQERQAAQVARGVDLTPAHVEVTENRSGMAFVPVQQFAVDFLVEQAEKELIKVRKASRESEFSDNEGKAEEGSEEFEAYRQVVRDALQARKERVEKFGGEDGFHAYREKTYGSALELAQDVALFSSIVPEISSVPPCFWDLEFDRIGYVIEIPTSGITIVKENGSKQVLDPQTQVIFFGLYPNREKFAKVMSRTGFERPDDFIWLSGDRPEEKLVAERNIPPLAGLTAPEWRSLSQEVEKMIKEKSKK